MYHTPLCPLFSPAYAFTSLHYLKHKGISLSSPLPLYFFLCPAPLSSALLISSLNFPQLSYLLTTLLFFSHILFSMSLCSSHLLFPLPSSPPSTLHSLPGFTSHPPSSPSSLSCHPFLTSPSTPSFLLLPSSPPARQPSSHHHGSPSDDCRAHFIWHEDKGLSTHVVSLQVLCNMKY